MERITTRRAVILLLLFCLVLGSFAFTLYDLQIIQTGGDTDNTTTYTTLTRVKAARGDILDRNGNKLVSNRASYDLVINSYVLLSSNGAYNAIYRLVTLCSQLGIEYTDNFPVTRERPFEYTLDEQSTAWRGYFQAYLSDLGGLDSDVTAPLLVQRLRERYNLPEEWTDEEARLVIGLLYELRLRNGITSLPNYVFIEDVSDENLSVIKEQNVPGLNVEASTVREYNTAYAAHILGHVGAMSPTQWEYYQNIEGYSMDALIGQSGLEAAFEEELHGVDGWRVDEVTSDGTVVRSYYKTEPQAGNNVEVTIDLSLQMAAEDGLAEVMEGLRNQEKENADGKDAEGGAVVAMDVKTGQILTCASYPTYDLSKFYEEYQENLSNPLKPFYNRATMAIYPPGSTYKMAMVVAGIDSNVINKYTEVKDEGIYKKYDLDVYCLAYSANGVVHQNVNAMRALCVSCNYFFYDLADKLALSVLDETAKGLGLGEATGIELPEELGHRNNMETKKELYEGEDAEWYQGDMILGGIGQANNKFTPMQLCVYASTLANKGNRYRATFLNRVVSSDYRTLVRENQPELLSHMDISDEAYDAVIEGMKMVASDSEGTAYRYFGMTGYSIAVCAKTGTAETGQSGSDNGAFVCFAPADDPQIAIVIYGEKAGHGTTMAQIARDMLDIYFGVGEIGDKISNENQLG
ncbi:MAG: hypothetical protein IJ422_06790 [Oscillospiraceae bacterium]|nr:hypothetical protein [Oscillospiraceae bacterium]